MKRRTILALGGLGAALAFAGWVDSRRDEDGILAVLRKRLDYLQLDPAGARLFAQDIVATHEISSARLRLVAAMEPLYRTLKRGGNTMIDREIRHGEERIATLYLLSSDFFQHGADLTRTIGYLGLYDPYLACSNPFARPMTRA